MTKLHDLHNQVQTRCQGWLLASTTESDMLMLDTSAAHLLQLMTCLKQDEAFACEQLSDLCAVDYLTYGESDWRTEDTTRSGFSRAVEENMQPVNVWDKPRFAVVYHLLSYALNHRIRVRVFLDESALRLPSVTGIWAGADWYEREAFDLFGIEFTEHPDLRRILTDYGFVGHPFRKDFPLIGKMELRYDATLKRCVYEPVSIQPRVLVPKVIRDDNRYVSAEKEVQDGGN